MTITNYHLVNNYAPELPFLTIMCHNDQSLGSFFSSFFGNGNGDNNSTSSNDVCCFSFFLGNVLVAMFTYASSTCFELASDTKGFFRGHNIVMEEDSKLWQWKIMAEELKDKD